MAATAAPENGVRGGGHQSPWAAADAAQNSHYSASLAVTQDLVARSLRRGGMDSATDGVVSRREVEGRQVRVELASVHSGSTSASLPPSGREFDVAPDPADEAAYDALEKAYNLAFAVCPPERLTRSQDAEQREQQCEIIPDMREITGGALSRAVARKQYALKHEELSCTEAAISRWKREEDLERQRSIDKLRNLRPKRDDCRIPIAEKGQHLQALTVSNFHIVLSGSSSVLNRANLFAATRTRRLKILQQLAEACRSRVLGRSRMRHPVDNGYIRPSALPLTLQIPPPLTESQHARRQASPNDETTDTLLPECKAVAEFLAAQLSLFADSLTQGHQRAVENRAAALASHQIWRDQQRAIADCELNLTRLKGRHVRMDESTTLDFNAQDLNPFQRAGEVFHSAWKSSLKRVEYGDWQLGPRADPCSSPLRESAVNRELQSLYSRGLNAVLVHRGEGVRNEIASFILQIQNLHTLGNVHVIVTEVCRLQEWDHTLSKEGILVIPLWGPDSDRDRLQSIGLPEGRKKWTPRVFLCSSETIALNISALAVFPLHLCIFDIDDPVRDCENGKSSSVWPYIMSLKCRQRVLVSLPSTPFDVRELALFAFPAALCSRRKILAWNCAALSKRLVASIIDAISSCTVCTDNDKRALSDWSAHLERITLLRVQREKTTLEGLTRDVTAYALAENGASHVMSLFQPEVEMPAVSMRKHIPTRRSVPVVVPVDNGPTQVSQVKKIQVPRKRRRQSSKSRKRISRCGECAGCLAEDCMKCGHCHDMKKYGGPGLRKQSCKRRKCLNPKTWGLQRKKRGRYEDAPVHEEREANTGDSSDAGSSDGDSLGDVDNGERSSSSSDESDDEPSIARVDLPGPTSYDSDSYASSHAGEDISESAQGSLFDHGDDTDADDPSSEGGNYSRAGRSRVMRCGKCRGCTSGDCMKCIHCQDMKKYGGPGLRKQSCKYRKCVAPKVVLLNQMREKQDAGGGDDATDGEQATTEDDISETQRTLDVDVSDLLQSNERLDRLDVIQECALVVRKFQFFRCQVCLRAFISQKLLDAHIENFHTSTTTRDAWPCCAEEVILHPAHQLGCLLASRRSINPNWQAPPVRAFAKLEGAGFEYFFFKPFAILGRLRQQWRDLYKTRGMANCKGLSGDSVDCHIGDDGMIAGEHALISWDHTSRFFTIRCLSFRSSLSVNGRDVHYSSRPLQLHSQDLIQIGATTAYFLLPTAESAEPTEGEALQIPRADVRGWLDATLRKRRAQAAQDEAIRQEIREHLQ